MKSKKQKVKAPRERFISDLNLNGTTAMRVQPKVGVWGPKLVPSTRSKKVWRVLVWFLFVLALIAVILYGWWYFEEMNAALEGLS